AIIGEEELSPLDKLYLKFGNEMEEKFFTQGEYEDRSIDQTLDLGWKILSILPREELYRIKDEFIEKYLPSTDEHSDEGSSD
ncbi:MAG: V-type ATP synthase subunit B, partial [Treponema sp.]|nr:V-type ATP synthase subunit B [Treponema sp.]